MVSLNPQSARGGGGGMPFDDRSMNINDDIPQETTPLISTTELPYRRIHTTPFIFIHILFVICFEVAIVLFQYLCSMFKQWTICTWHDPYNIALYVHAGFYVVNVIFDRTYHYYQDLSRRDGYLEFYRRTRNLRRTPLLVISAGNAILVAMIKLLEDFQDKIDPIKPWHCLAILTTVEVIIMLIALIWYFVITIRFNKQHERPDAAQEDLLSTFVTSAATTNEIGFRDETYADSVLEKQADLIRYLRERNAFLSSKILEYKSRVNLATALNEQL